MRPHNEVLLELTELDTIRGILADEAGKDVAAVYSAGAAEALRWALGARRVKPSVRACQAQEAR